MRRLIIVLGIVLVTAAAIFVYLRFRRPTPTEFNWKPIVSTIAGDGSPVFRNVAKATEAGFSDPFGIAVGSDGSIYVSDAGESNKIRKITPEGALTTLAGGDEGFADGSPGAFNTPSGLAIDDDGNLYVADTSNNRIRKVTPDGVVSTVAGNGTPGFADGDALSATFNGPVGVAVDKDGNILVADTYNDRIRKITVDGHVVTIAGDGIPGDADGEASRARFNTPCGVAVMIDGSVIVADTGNDKLRKITPNGQVTSVNLSFVDDPSRSWLNSPLGLALTYDGFLYVTEFDRGVVVQVAPDGKACVLAGKHPGFADGFGADARFNHPAAVAVNRTGDLLVTDAANYLVRRLSHDQALRPVNTLNEQLPRLTLETLGEKNLLWPLDPQNQPHEVVATMGEVRGTFDSKDSRDHLHSGLDVAGAYGDFVRVIRSEKVSNPMPTWGFGELSEGLRIGVISYIHIQVGRDKDGDVFNDPRFVELKNDDGKLAHIRVQRGTRFRTGEAIGTVNKMYHVHLIIGPSGGEINPLSLAPVGFKDTISPTIEKGGIQFFSDSGTRLIAMDHGRLVVQGRVSIVVDAFDRTDRNGERRRLGLYALGYQIFKDNNNQPGDPTPGFASPQMTILFNRLPGDDSATKITYASDSGITVYGSQSTRFLYQITNTVRDGHARTAFWNTSELPKGDYVLRVIAKDFSGNEAQENRDVLLTVK